MNTHPVSVEDFGALSDGHVYRLSVMPLFTRQAKIAARCDFLPPVQVLSFRVLLQRVLKHLEPLGPSVRHHVHTGEPRRRQERRAHLSHAGNDLLSIGEAVRAVPRLFLRHLRVAQGGRGESVW